MGTLSKRVLIVEDVEDIRSCVTDVLEDHGYRVACAADGVEALSWLQAAKELPDVILLDLMMPRMDGYQFRAEQSADARLSSIPVLLMTAAGDCDAKAREVGACGFLKKPFRDIETILGEVERALRT
jgi:CheY-like chemotaxis protein